MNKIMYRPYIFESSCTFPIISESTKGRSSRIVSSPAPSSSNASLQVEHLRTFRSSLNTGRKAARVRPQNFFGSSFFFVVNFHPRWLSQLSQYATVHAYLSNKIMIIITITIKRWCCLNWNTCSAFEICSSHVVLHSQNSRHVVEFYEENFH